MNTTTIQCNCQTCRIDAERIGAAFPMTATVDSRFAALLTTRKSRHNVVHDANHPVLGASFPSAR